MLLASLTIIIGIALLVWSADKFVIGAASLAHNLGMSPLLIGLTVVSIGTSAPEILVSVTAALVGASGLAIGNALGSNIANIGLVLGITALIAPLPVHSKLLRKELPILCVISLAAGLLLLDKELSRSDGIILLSMLAVSLYLIARYQPSADDQELIKEEEEELPQLKTTKAVFWLVFGLIVLVLSSRALVWAASFIAQSLGVSDLVIGLTIVAIGTSLPELAASVASALKGHHEIAIGNVIGSNLFNLLAVMALPAMITPYQFGVALLLRDYGIMLLFTLLLAGLCYASIRTKKDIELGRWVGLLFCGGYIAYLTLLYLQSSPSL